MSKSMRKTVWKTVFKRALLTAIVAAFLVTSFVGGAWYALRFQSVEYDAESGLYVLSVFGRGECYYFGEDE